MIAAMKQIRLVMLLACCVALVVVEAAAGTPRQFQSGKLLDVGSDERLVEGTTIIHAVYQVQVGDLNLLRTGRKGTQTF